VASDHSGLPCLWGLYKLIEGVRPILGITAKD
jgi:hypothetical protein